MDIGILGLGLIGGTIAKALQKRHHISAFDLSETALDYAIDHKIIHRKIINLIDFLNQNEVIYLCLYPNDIINFIFQNKHLFPKNRLFIEISGIKNKLIDTLDKQNGKLYRMVYTHPIAGSEKVGVYHSDANIFKNANYVITPTEKNLSADIEIAKTLATEMGFGRISIVTPEEHDRMIAYTSQLTHILSLSLVNSLSGDLDTKNFIGDSYRDLTRIAHINEQLWPSLLLGNKTHLIDRIESFESQLRQFKDALKMNDMDKLKTLMLKSKYIKEMMNKGENHDS